MAWGNIGGGFATGLQAGSQAVARAMQAQIDKENQEYLKSEREREAQTRAEYETAGSQAETKQQTGLQVTGPEAGAKPFYIPADAKDAAATYAREGYTVAEAPTAYSETQVRGGKTLRQSEISPEHAEMGYDPNRGLQDQYNAPAARNQRLLDVAVRRGKFADAAALSGLTSNELNQQLTREKIADLPQERQARDVTIRTGLANLTKAERTNEIDRREDDWRKASKSPEAAIQHYNDNYRDGSTAYIKTNKDGTQQIVQRAANGDETPLGKPYRSWDGPDGGRRQILGNIDSLAAEQFKLDAQHENRMKEIEAQTKGRLKEVAAMKADKKINWEPGQQAEYSKIESEIADAVEKNDYNKISQLNVRLQALTNRVLMGNNRPPQPISTPQRGEQQYTNIKTWQEAAAKATERLQSTGQWPANPADQTEALEREVGPRPGQRGAASPRSPYDVPVPTGDKTPPPPKGGGGQRGGLQVKEQPGSIDSMISSHPRGVTIKVPARSLYSDLNGRTFGTKEEARKALLEHAKRRGVDMTPQPAAGTDY